MQFHTEQIYRAPVAAVARAYSDPALYGTLAASPSLGRPEVLSHVEDGDVVRLAVRHCFVGGLAPTVTKVIDPAKLTWVEHTVHHVDRGEVRFELAPDHYADRLRASGRARLRRDGDVTRRIVEGELAISGVPLLGRMVERAIISGLQEHLAAEAPLVDRFVSGTA